MVRHDAKQLRTYTEAQYSTPSSRALVRDWLEQHGGDRESVARYMSGSLRIGGIRVCRALISAAVEELNEHNRAAWNPDTYPDPEARLMAGGDYP